MGYLEGFAYGVAGGLFAEVLGLFKLRHLARDARPEWLKSGFYWGVTLCMVLAGGLLVVAWLRSGIALSPLLAINVGASAPLIIGSLVAQAPPISPGKVD